MPDFQVTLRGDKFVRDYYSTFHRVQKNIPIAMTWLWWLQEAQGDKRLAENANKLLLTAGQDEADEAINWALDLGYIEEIPGDGSQGPGRGRPGSWSEGLDTGDYTYTPAPRITVGEAREAARAYEAKSKSDLNPLGKPNYGRCPSCRIWFESAREAIEHEERHGFKPFTQEGFEAMNKKWEPED